MSTAAMLGLLAGCGNGSGADVRSDPPAGSPGTAAPARETPAPGVRPGHRHRLRPGHGLRPRPHRLAGPAADDGAPGRSDGRRPRDERGRLPLPHLRAAGLGGPQRPGRQENFPVVLTNTSGRTCTLRGYPGAAFVNASGGQVGADPKRAPGTPVTVTVRPGQSAWAGLTFSNPEVSGARAATPAGLLVTPPDERDALRVAWPGGPVPVSGNASSVRLTVLSPGTGP
ncbi:DUF4232 domain-containing protein [Streptomyces nogalater]